MQFDSLVVFLLPTWRYVDCLKKKKVFISKTFFLVIRLGLEPKTPTLKVLCSTS